MVAGRGAFAPCASGMVRGGRQWRHRSPYDDVKAGQRYVTQAWREVDRSPTALLFIPFLAPSLSSSIFFSRTTLRQSVGSTESNPRCLVFFFLFPFFLSLIFLRRIFLKAMPPVRKIRKFEINGMKVRDERFGEKFRRFDGGWMFRDLEFLERIGRSFVSLMLGAFAVGLLLPSVENIWKLTGLARVINIKYNRLIFISFILI